MFCLDAEIFKFKVGITVYLLIALTECAFLIFFQSWAWPMIEAIEPITLDRDSQSVSL